MGESADGIQSKDIVPEANLAGESLKNADLVNAPLLEANLSNANLSGANLNEAVLNKANLAEARLDGADLTGATLIKTDLSGARLDGADLEGATLIDADLSNAVLAGADLSGSDIRGVTLSGTEISRSTEFGKFTELERDASSPKDWDEIARTYHRVKNAHSENGLISKARNYYLLEQWARGREAKTTKGIGGTLAWLGSASSRILTGYGVGIWRVAVVSFLLLITSTVWYSISDIQNPIFFSIVTFTSSPPSKLPPELVTRVVSAFETFFGTLLIVLLGYVLGNRERF